MKKSFTMLVTLILCIFLLVGCGNANDRAMTKQTQLLQTSTSNSDKVMIDTESKELLQPEYDYNANTLSLRNLSTNEIIAAYSFDTPLSPVLTEKTTNGVVMLSNQSTSEVINANGLAVVQSSGTAGTFTYWQFDDDMKLLNRYELTDLDISERLKNDIYTVSPDGNRIISLNEDDLYLYSVADNTLKQISITLDEKVYFLRIKSSDDGQYLAYYGDINQEGVTAYGTVDLESGKGSIFEVQDFAPTSLTINGDYAVISNAVPPASKGGPSKTGRVLFVDLANRKGKEIQVESGGETDIVTPSSDGKYVITCCGTDADSGVLRCYRTSDGGKAAEQPYGIGTNCRPCAIIVQAGAAYAILMTDAGKAVSPTIILP